VEQVTGAISRVDCRLRTGTGRRLGFAFIL